MNKKGIHTPNAPAAIGPYQQGIRVGDWVFTSGQIALDPATGEFMSGEIEQETELTLKNVQAILNAEGLSLDHVVKATVYLADMGDFARMNQVYEKFFADSKPARACVQAAALPKGARVEIDVIATAAG
ncbi:MAG: RidA family protein [Nitrospinaceae bacterium]|nr:RidA family protein [Nitrospinaceae bacterium]NIR57439.1 RidA family protein [Nitrospinaceae bacterium]NIS87906.1 RidA family protein [Nitrospinaceae bacterium]NIT84775.1 RidA family protein [Nitrospinaceae bacterium]NIU46949.1 RidA family protein [Nitrospinaceae bacterium]